MRHCCHNSFAVMRPSSLGAENLIFAWKSIKSSGFDILRSFLATIHKANPVLMCAWWNLYIQRVDGCCCFLLFAVYGRHWLRHEKLSVFSRKQSFLSCLYSLRDCGLLLGCRANPFNARKLLAMPIGRIGKKMISGFILIS